MGRKPIGSASMTPAERQRRCRAIKANRDSAVTVAAPPSPAASHNGAAVTEARPLSLNVTLWRDASPAARRQFIEAVTAEAIVDVVGAQAFYQAMSEDQKDVAADAIEKEWDAASGRPCSRCDREAEAATERRKVEAAQRDRDAMLAARRNLARDIGM